jgi:hypothetical protein
MNLATVRLRCYNLATSFWIRHNEAELNMSLLSALRDIVEDYPCTFFLILFIWLPEKACLPL